MLEKYYKLNVIISVGYRVKSQRGVQFRIWATNVLKEYIKKGFAMDDDRLKELGKASWWYFDINGWEFTNWQWNCESFGGNE